MVRIRRNADTGDETASRAVERKHEILEAAAIAFRRNGFAGTGMRDIASDLGMTVGNLYYYFENKRELLAFCQEETLSRLIDLAEWARSRDERPDSRLYLLVVGAVVCLNIGTSGSLAHMEVENLDGQWKKRITRERDRFERLVRSLVRDGVDAGVFRQVEPKLTTFAILGAVNWTVKWFRPDGGRRARAIGMEFAEHLVGGLLEADVELERPSTELIDLSANPRRSEGTAG